MNKSQSLTLFRGGYSPTESTVRRCLNVSEWMHNGPEGEGRVRVSRDDIADASFGFFYEDLDEIGQSRVQLLQHGIVNAAIKSAMSVLIDDVNLEDQTIREWMSLADRYNMTFRVEDFEEGLPALPEPTPTEAANGEAYVADETLPKLFIFDVDGTIARMQGRSPFAYDRAEDDALIENVAHVMDVLEVDHNIAIITGREEWSRPHLTRWLEKHGLRADHIFMRPTGDRRPDDVVKLEIFDKSLRNQYHVMGVFDDRRRVCQMWERIGVTLFRVGPMEADF